MANQLAGGAKTVRALQSSQQGAITCNSSTTLTSWHQTKLNGSKADTQGQEQLEGLETQFLVGYCSAYSIASGVITRNSPFI